MMRKMRIVPSDRHVDVASRMLAHMKRSEGIHDCGAVIRYPWIARDPSRRSPTRYGGGSDSGDHGARGALPRGTGGP